MASAFRITPLTPRLWNPPRPSPDGRSRDYSRNADLNEAAAAADASACG